MLNIGQLIASLTHEEAYTYNEQTDKLCWIEYNLLDPNNLPRRYAERVEDALIVLYEQLCDEVAADLAAEDRANRALSCDHYAGY